jgi:hypothetical protein
VCYDLERAALVVEYVLVMASLAESSGVVVEDGYTNTPNTSINVNAVRCSM